jgi:hypothetical protein
MEAFFPLFALAVGGSVILVLLSAAWRFFKLALGDWMWARRKRLAPEPVQKSIESPWN